ncbi:VanZ family protein [Bradyrhizobium monzae]|uniref:VanZ family protein n=1 Tax=Bradyrhizobium sp. Oc8 TaxID=2876780 RepID=UPI001F18BEFC|nr:VanZ family protein [Bradyrhizobium sp. Oc8]
MLGKSIILAAWCALGLIVFVTLSPIGLRPETGSVGLERFAAYALLGALFVGAYPQHFAKVMLFIIAVSISLELLQHLTPDRHGHLADALEKISGGLAGCSLIRLTQAFCARSRG